MTTNEDKSQETNLLQELAAEEPEHVIEINGLEYARIYDLRP
jgi:hypothetical protein